MYLGKFVGCVSLLRMMIVVFYGLGYVGVRELLSGFINFVFRGG